LLDVIDKTISPMGGRLLRRWLAFPLKDKTKIEERLDVVDFLKNNPEILQSVQYQIKQISDLERLISKIATGKASPKEVVILKDSLKTIQPVKKTASESSDKSLQKIGKNLDDCELVIQKISETLNEEAPVSINKGNAIKMGVNPEL